MASEQVTIRINVSADTREIDKVKRKLAELSAQSAVTGGGVGDLGDEIDNVGGSSRAASRDIDNMSRSNERLHNSSRKNHSSLQGMSKMFSEFTEKLGGGMLFAMKAWAVQTGVMGAGLAAITAGFKIASVAGKLFQGTMAAIAAGAAAAAVAVTTAAAAYRQYIAASNAMNYNPTEIGGKTAGAMAGFRTIQSDSQLSALGMKATMGAYAGISQNAPVTGDMSQSLRALADFAVASGDVEKGMQAAGQFLGMLRKEGKLTDQVAKMGENLGPQFQEAIQTAVKGGKISEADFLSALNAGALNDKVTGLLSGVNKTLFGQAKSFMGDVISMAGDVGQSFLPEIQTAFEKITDIAHVMFMRVSADLGGFATGPFIDTILKATQKLSDFTTNLFEKFLPKSKGMLSGMGDFFGKIKDWFKDVGDTLRPLQEGGQVIIDTFKPLFGEVFGGFGDSMGKFNDLIVQNKDKFLAFGESLGGLAQQIGRLFDNLRTAFVKALPAITNIVNGITKLVSVLASLVGLMAKNDVTALFAVLGGFMGGAMLKGGKVGKAIQGRLGGAMRGMSFFGGGGGKSPKGDFRRGLRDGLRDWRDRRNAFDWQYGVGKALKPRRQSIAESLRNYRTGYRKPGMFNTPPGGIGPVLPATRGQALGAGVRGAMSAVPGMMGKYAPYALMAGSVFSSQEAQMPMMMGGMVASANPMLGVGIAGLGTATTAKTKMGGALSGAAGGAAIGAMLPGGPLTIAGGAIVGAVYGGIMAAINKRKEMDKAGKAIVDSFAKNTRETVKSMRTAGAEPAEIKAEFKARIDSAKKIRESARLLKTGSADLEAYRGAIEWFATTKEADQFKKGKVSANVLTKVEGGGKNEYFTKADAAAADRGRDLALQIQRMRNEGLRGLKGKISDKEYANLKKFINTEAPADQAGKTGNDLVSKQEAEQKKFLDTLDTRAFNIDRLSRATGMSEDAIVEMAKKAGFDLYESGVSLADAIKEIGIKLPQSIEEVNANIRKAMFQSIQDTFDEIFAPDQAALAMDQLGQQIADTVGPIPQDQAAEYLKTFLEQTVMQFPKDPLRAYEAMQTFGPGGAQYQPGGQLQGRESQILTPKNLQFFETATGAMKSEITTQTAQLVASAIQQTTNGSKTVDVATLSSMMTNMGMTVQQMSDLQKSAQSSIGSAQMGGKTQQDPTIALQTMLQTAGAAIPANLGTALMQTTANVGNSINSALTTGGTAAGTLMGISLISQASTIGNGVAGGMISGASTNGTAIGSAAAGPMKTAVSSAISQAPKLKVESVPPIQVHVTVDKTDGDTTSSRLAATMARHRSMDSMLSGKRSITSSLRNDNLGSLGSDHATGNAYDLVGQNLGAYQRLVQSTGGFAEFHGGTQNRHLHVVPGPGLPAGDTATPAMLTTAPVGPTNNNNSTFNINVHGGNSSPEMIADSVMQKIAERERTVRERS